MTTRTATANHRAKAAIVRFLSDDRGATTIEYGLIVAIMSVALLSIYLGVQSGLRGTYTSVNTALQP